MTGKATSQKEWESRLHIHTAGRDETESSDRYFPYEPTPYCVLERLSESGYVGKDDHLLDCGCGKGRVCFFMAARCGCRSTGIDFSDKMIRYAEDNLMKFPWKNKVDFRCCRAEEYDLTDEDAIFFFNPFSDIILHSVIGKIRRSCAVNPRRIRLFCYYPSDEFIACLMTDPDLLFLDDIDCQDLFDGKNPREKIVIFEM